jgi:hypothetical protein
MADTITVMNNAPAVEKALNDLTHRKVMVGIPSTDPSRSGAITNAALGYIHEFGNPGRNIPARPFLVPGVRSVQPQSIAGLKRAAKAAMEGNNDLMEKQLEAIGQRAATAVKAKMTAGLAPPLAASTVRARLRKTKAGQKQLRKLKAAGTNLTDWGAANLRPLIDTGQLRQAVTYVVRKV